MWLNTLGWCWWLSKLKYNSPCTMVRRFADEFLNIISWNVRSGSASFRRIWKTVEYARKYRCCLSLGYWMGDSANMQWGPATKSRIASFSLSIMASKQIISFALLLQGTVGSLREVLSTIQDYIEDVILVNSDLQLGAFGRWEVIKGETMCIQLLGGYPCMFWFSRTRRSYILTTRGFADW